MQEMLPPSDKSTAREQPKRDLRPKVQREGADSDWY